MPYLRIWPMLKTLRWELERELPAGASPAWRQAQLFAEILRRIPVGATAACALAGEMGLEFVSAAERSTWEARLGAWQAAIAPPAVPAAPDAFGLMDRCYACSPSDGGVAHTTIACEDVLAQGLAGVCARLESERAGAPTAKQDYLHAMHLALTALAEFSRRYAPWHPACARIPWEAPRNFAEALQSLWFLQLGTAISEGGSPSLSLGRLDQYLLPFARADLARGLPPETLAAQLADFFRMLNHPEFADAAMTVNLGGRDETGQSQFNELSRLIVAVAARLRLPAPLLAVRVDASLAPADFELLCQPELLTIGQPTFYGEDPCRRALARRGVPAAEIPGWAVNSCMGLMLPGREWSDMWGSVLNVLLPLELALNGGRPFAGELPLTLATRPPPQYRDFDELFATVGNYLDELAGLYIAETERRRAQRLPNPFVSAFLDDCIARGRDRLQGGVRYRTLIVECFGLVNCADALSAIRELAFATGAFTLPVLVAAAKADFEGAAGLQQRLLALPKYGNGHAEADAMTARLAARFAQAVTRHSTAELACAPSFHTLNAHVGRGAKTAASLDGRRRGEALAKNVGTRPGLAVQGHGALVLSASTIDQAAFFGGQALDLWLDPALFRDAEGRQRFRALLEVYFQRGGLQVQINGLAPAALRAAQAEPERHRDLIVRIGGYSVRFTDLSRAAQDDFIARFATGG